MVVTNGPGAAYHHLTGQGLPEPGPELRNFGSKELPRFKTEFKGVTDGLGAAFHPLNGQGLGQNGS